jgi:copper(I)-binding protein
MKKFLNIVGIFFLTTSLFASDISVENARIRMMPPGSPMTAGYFLITNNSDKDITLVGVSSSKYKSMEIHDIVKEGDMMKMIKQESITIAANSKLEFKPMSYHLMFMMPKENITENQEIDVVFNTKSGGYIFCEFYCKKNEPNENGAYGAYDEKYAKT